jgi:hypothetical protein
LRTSDPELTDGYPPTPFDAEDAPDIVASVFAEVQGERWDAPMTLLTDRDAALASAVPTCCLRRRLSA